jgi:hypothetical protein
MKQLYIQGIFNQAAGRRDQCVADLNVMLDATASTAKGGNQSQDIKNKIEEVTHHDAMLLCMQKYFSPPAADGNAPPADGDAPTRVLDEGETESSKKK